MPPPQHTRRWSLSPVDHSASPDAATTTIAPRATASNVDRLVLTLVLTVTPPPVPEATFTVFPASVVMRSERSRDVLSTPVPQSPVDDYPLPEVTVVNSNSESPSIAVRSALVGAGAALLGVAIFATILCVLRRHHRRRLGVLDRPSKSEPCSARSSTSGVLLSTINPYTYDLPSTCERLVERKIPTAWLYNSHNSRPPTYCTEVEVSLPATAQPKRISSIAQNVRGSRYAPVDLGEEFSEGSYAI
ncbi:hypothetical protein BC628DRAFT_1147190 [Trametes gibbosa]|nr:hypothetical protein BC628DRAFT_1147190 [Trametes gibbosa]